MLISDAQVTVYLLTEWFRANMPQAWLRHAVVCLD